MTSWQSYLNGLKILSYGASGIVFVIDENSVIKVPCGGADCAQEHRIERRIYERLGRHPRIVTLLEIRPYGIVLERLKEPLRKRLLDMRDGGVTPSTPSLLKWSAQVAEGLHYLHSKGVLQADIGCHNLLLDVNDDLKFCDFAGSSIDGEDGLVGYESGSQYPCEPGKSEITVKAELFALGSTLYEISTTMKPYQDKTFGNIQKLYSAKQFPDTQDLLLGDIILKCWNGQYTEVGGVMADMSVLGPGALEGRVGIQLFDRVRTTIKVLIARSTLSLCLSVLVVLFILYQCTMSSLSCGSGCHAT